MPRESKQARRERAAAIITRLRAKYPHPRAALHFRNPLEMLVATILSAQCTDEVVNQVTPALFKRYRTARAYAQADPAELEAMIRRTGFFRNKAKSLMGMGQALTERFGGKVPRTMEELLTLPGVARKTANVVLQNSYGVVVGIVVDTHVQRLAQRMGFTGQTDPPKIEQDLMALLAPEDWQFAGHGLIFHGRDTCSARKPACARCEVADLCPQLGVK